MYFIPPKPNTAVQLGHIAKSTAKMFFSLKESYLGLWHSLISCNCAHKILYSSPNTQNKSKMNKMQATPYYLIDKLFIIFFINFWYSKFFISSVVKKNRKKIYNSSIF